MEISMHEHRKAPRPQVVPSVPSPKQGLAKMTCLICSSTDIAPYRIANGYQLFECKNCQLLSTDLTNISPDFLHHFYKNDYYGEKHNEAESAFGYDSYVKDAIIWQKNAEKIVSQALRSMPGKRPLRILDIGCAHGFLVKEAVNQGLDGWGIDFSDEAIRYAREGLGLKSVILGDFMSYPLELNSYDVVVLNGTLEHFVDPLIVLKRCHEILAPGGVLIDITLHHRCGLLGWVTLKPPEHLYYFKCSNLRLLHQRAGFIEQIQLKHYWKYYSLAQYIKLLARMIPYPFKWFSNIKFFERFALLFPTNEVIITARK